MNTTIREPDQNDAEGFLLWTLLDRHESEQTEFGDGRIARAVYQPRCGFMLVLLRALSAWAT